MKVTTKRKYETSSAPDEVLKDILHDRGITDVETFLHPVHPKDIPFRSFFSPKELGGGPTFEERWKKTFALLEKIHTNGDTIVVYTDYDADGVTGGAVLWEALHKAGFKAMPYIPDRKKEGYGFSRLGIDTVLEKFHPKLIISVDHGIVGHEYIEYAASLNIPVIVTDHHQKQNGDPQAAFATFHTSELSGSGVAYFFAKQLYESLGKQLSDDYLGLAAIGSVADLVPLTGATRSVVKYGLEALQKTSRLGLRFMLREAGLDDKTLDTYHIGFMIAPRINAFGRLEHAIDALRLLCTNSYKQATELAGKAGLINTQRQKIVETAVTEALKSVHPEDRIHILYSQEWDEGIIGLIAGKIMQTYGKPAIVMTKADGHAKASVRSIPSVDIMKFLTSFKSYFVDMGGHKAAAGFTILTENVSIFTTEALEKANKEITDDMLIPELLADAELPIESATVEMARALQALQPFGMSNPKPIFLIEGTVQEVTSLGKTGVHSKILLRNRDTYLDLLMFQTPLRQAPKKGTHIQAAVELDINVWKTKESIQAIVKQIL